MKFNIIGAIVFLIIGAWMATFTDPAKDTFENYEKDQDVYEIHADNLARRIIDGDQSFMLIDIRDAKADKKVSIDRATPLSFADFVKDATLVDGFSTDKEILVIGDDDKKAEKLAAFFAHKGYYGAFVKGGFKAWNDEVLNPPKPAENANDEAFRLYAERVSISNFLQGKNIGAGVQQKKRVKKVFKRVVKSGGGGGC